MFPLRGIAKMLGFPRTVFLHRQGVGVAPRTQMYPDPQVAFFCFAQKQYLRPGQPGHLVYNSFSWAENIWTCWSLMVFKATGLVCYPKVFLVLMTLTSSFRHNARSTTHLVNMAATTLTELHTGLSKKWLPAAISTGLAPSSLIVAATNHHSLVDQSHHILLFASKHVLYRIGGSARPSEAQFIGAYTCQHLTFPYLHVWRQKINSWWLHIHPTILVVL